MVRRRNRPIRRYRRSLTNREPWRVIHDSINQPASAVWNNVRHDENLATGRPMILKFAKVYSDMQKAAQDKDHTVDFGPIVQEQVIAESVDSGTVTVTSGAEFYAKAIWWGEPAQPEEWASKIGKKVFVGRNHKRQAVANDGLRLGEPNWAIAISEPNLVTIYREEHNKYDEDQLMNADAEERMAELQRQQQWEEYEQARAKCLDAPRTV